MPQRSTTRMPRSIALRGALLSLQRLPGTQTRVALPAPPAAPPPGTPTRSCPEARFVTACRVRGLRARPPRRAGCRWAGGGRGAAAAGWSCQLQGADGVAGSRERQQQERWQAGRQTSTGVAGRQAEARRGATNAAAGTPPSGSRVAGVPGCCAAGRCGVAPPTVTPMLGGCTKQRAPSTSAFWGSRKASRGSSCRVGRVGGQATARRISVGGSGGGVGRCDGGVQGRRGGGGGGDAAAHRPRSRETTRLAGWRVWADEGAAPQLLRWAQEAAPRR